MNPTLLHEVYIDGASRGNPGPGGIGVVFRDEGGRVVHEFSRALGETTNNVAEYLALIYALQVSLIEGLRRLSVKTDSELLARQIAGVYQVRNPQLRILYDLAKHLLSGLEKWEIVHVPREQNKDADRLAGKAADRQ